jgi:CRISPR-associated endonuclease Cas1
MTEKHPTDEPDTVEDECPEDIDTSGPPLGLDDFFDIVDTNRTTYSPDQLCGQTVIVDGHNIAVRVRNGCLELVDGVHPYRRTRTVIRADAGPLAKVRRVVVLGAGMITTEAMAWCHHRDLPLVVARTGSTPTMVGAAALFDHAGLRRAQAIAPYVPDNVGCTVAVNAARWLLDLRLAGQARIAEMFFVDDDACEAIHGLRRAVATASTVREMLLAEGKAADRYWSCWERVQLRFAHGASVPDHWRRFPGRRSRLLANNWSNRNASCPANALINFGMKVLESEAVVACLSIGLDPSLGLIHADRAGRPSAALDLMESARGLVEETVLSLVRVRTFRKTHFAEDVTGKIRVCPPVSHDLAVVIVPLVRDQLGPVAEQLAAMLATAAGAKVTVPTVLSGERRGRTARPKQNRFPATCHRCGGPLPPGRRTYCDGCLPDARKDRGLSQVGTSTRRRARRERDSHSDSLRSEAGRRRAADEAAWEAHHQGMRRPDPSEFTPIAIGLPAFTPSQIARHVGVSVSTASKWRRGVAVPHVRHWAGLAQLVGVALPDGMLD